MWGVKIAGTGSYTPDNVITNEDLSKMVDTSDEWIVTRTGIKERRITKGENTTEIATKAAMNALENSGITAEELDLIIVATLTSDMVTPSTSCLVQAKIGAKKAAAFDINAACSGFIYGLNVGAQFIKTGTYKKVLVIGVEVLSKIVDWKDRGTCVLFGDGAGAAVITASDEQGLLSVHLGAEGDKGHFLECTGLTVNNPYAEGYDESGFKKAGYVVMEGGEVFKFATKAIIDSIDKVLKAEGLTIDDIDYIIPHQANFRIIDYARRKLNQPLEKFYVNLDKYGNTSSASIPIALDEMNRKGMLKKGNKFIMVGFGGGLTYGAALIQW